MSTENPRSSGRGVVKIGREPKDAREYGDAWRAPKDGKQMVDPKSKWMRK
jgi:hypothetical protein